MCVGSAHPRRRIEAERIDSSSDGDARLMHARVAAMQIDRTRIYQPCVTSNSIRFGLLKARQFCFHPLVDCATQFLL